MNTFNQKKISSFFSILCFLTTRQSNLDSRILRTKHQSAFEFGLELNFDSIEEIVSLFISGSKTNSSGGRLGSFKLFLIIKKG